MEILVNDQLCVKWEIDKHPPDDVASVTCDPPLLGNIVKIQIPRNGTFVTLCEVQIFVCADGWFGDDCDKQCQCFNNTEICDKITGQCPSGCAPGFIGADCQTACAGGYYGINCTSECGNCLNDLDICDKETGACPSGCSAGWTSVTCTQPCADGFYGINCTNECGRCLEDCNKTSGACLGGCQPGWLNGTCQQR
ncbi:multiple epidermal growth factor-like domains protein 11 [Haliotis rubra]|uniref:multiple epidermal growth factor-like domains protein 11 n=1 Tax=Haliotis rubra TaxID=36100 RepID=UPI001EE54C0D|nr:multiple epidermal growth factor-like domains protein 11 [Haliotis rubra]